MRLSRKVVLPFVLGVICARAQTAPPFAGLEQWKAALSSADMASFRALYSVSPAARFTASNDRMQDISTEFDFWQKLVASGVTDLRLTLSSSQDQPGLHFVSFQVAFRVKTPAGPRTRYVLAKQGWQNQGNVWRILLASHSDILKMPQPANLNPNLYPANVDAKKEIKEALARAARENKRLMLIFGGNWCYDCHVLDFALHNSDAAPIARRSFVIVHVDIGEGRRNPDLVALYKIPLQRGVPAVAVLDSTGKLLYSEQNGGFSKARSMDPDDLIAFLEKWRLPLRPGPRAKN